MISLRRQKERDIILPIQAEGEREHDWLNRQRERGSMIGLTRQREREGMSGPTRQRSRGSIIGLTRQREKGACLA